MIYEYVIVVMRFVSESKGGRNRQDYRLVVLVLMACYHSMFGLFHEVRGRTLPYALLVARWTPIDMIQNEKKTVGAHLRQIYKMKPVCNKNGALLMTGQLS